VTYRAPHIVHWTPIAWRAFAWQRPLLRTAMKWGPRHTTKDGYRKSAVWRGTRFTMRWTERWQEHGVTLEVGKTKAHVLNAFFTWRALQ
jgi:hypothetical protein